MSDKRIDIVTERLPLKDRHRIQRLCEALLRSRKRFEKRIQDMLDTPREDRDEHWWEHGRRRHLLLCEQLDAYVKRIYKDHPEQLVDSKGQDRTREITSLLIDMWAEARIS